MKNGRRLNRVCRFGDPLLTRVIRLEDVLRGKLEEPRVRGEVLEEAGAGDLASIVSI
jgi:hypothetical protein